MSPWAALATPAPWLASYDGERGRLLAAHRAGMSVADTLNAAVDGHPVELAAGPLRFVAAQALPAGEAYEAFIARTASVPTRDNLHDLFNGLVWLRFGQVKRRLNELQAAEIVRCGVGPRRGVLRDALTLFDENGAWLKAPIELMDALRRRDWQALFITHRAAWRDAELTLFGHALMEKLTQPRKAITAHAWCMPAHEAAERPVLEWLAQKPLALPVLGVPGWWRGNEEPGFYEDAAVFRPPR
ncbi:DUF3025 domain-containing protein [Piscinibacter sp. XHJ-5]|uniref:DUF3025 domain-containing protein n=1 Tax=Piscinibacter sp. XHJ-5 TaxID=3037797 RepID=UPI00245319B9|nr:DUF3025 domain-containing protein [Piscinibacter sp. XHJ-5]